MRHRWIPEMAYQSRTRVTSTRQDKIQLNQVDSTKTSARVNVTLLTHVLVGLLTALFAIFTSVLTFSTLASNPLMYSLGDRSVWLL